MIPRIAILCAVLALTAASRSYNGYKVYNVNQQNEQQMATIRQLELSNPHLDFWHLTKRVGDSAKVMVAPEHQQEFINALKSHGITFTELIHNVESTIDHPSPKRKLSRSENILTTYLSHEAINSYLDELATKYASSVKVQEIGTSHEGRSMKTITINEKKGNAVIFVDAGIHAREWIAPSTALYAINQLVEHADKHQDILANLTWIILPVVNPDGYAYSHSDERMWRKTRKPSGKKCFGTDANRNFDFHWGEVGASASSCSDTFRGETAFSEPETQHVRDALLSLKGKCKFYLTLHSYGNYLLYPWGWTSALPETVDDLDEVAQAGASAIKQATGGRYEVGSSTNVLYEAAGGSDDWAFAVAEVPISITMELPGGGSGGFNPPPSHIEESVKESWIGIQAMALKVAQKY
ncbi:carboxypeptidase B [Uranotaenia lowii]|uniref:carboxypeptidase B n=1 Tax=Uranotaenia lowii TaxID=190385 RepID=UPI0024784A90|nr:carboxypeptidase B [Uranotaenia lowii]